MQRSTRVIPLLILALTALPTAGQILAPGEISDQAAHKLQVDNMPRLKAVVAAVEAHKFPFPFYFSRVLDIDEKKAAQSDQRSIRFEFYNGQMTLMMTGNYYASYSATQLTANRRVRKTMEDVVLPLLRAAVPQFASDDSFEGYAFEISHHIRDNAMGVKSENAENLVFLIPRAAAQHLIHSTTEEQMQVAILESKVFVNAEAFNLWVNGERPTEDEIAHRREQVTGIRQKQAAVDSTAKAFSTEQPSPTVSTALLKPSPMPARIVLPQTLSELKLKYAGRIFSMQKQLAPEANFVSYVSPDFVGFHEAIFLQLAINVPFDPSVAGSRYKLAALTFDDHIAHLIRPVLAYFNSNADFDGVVFSSTLQQQGKTGSLAVEYFFPFSAMNCYAQYDCSGQQLIDSGFILINGERATLTLQVAEGEHAAQP